MQKWNEWYESSNSRTRNASAAWKNKKETTKKKTEKLKIVIVKNDPCIYLFIFDTVKKFIRFWYNII